MSQKPFLRVDNIRKRFGPIIASDGVSLEIEEGEIHSLLGEDQRIRIRSGFPIVVRLLSLDSRGFGLRRGGADLLQLGGQLIMITQSRVVRILRVVQPVLGALARAVVFV